MNSATLHQQRIDLAELPAPPQPGVHLYVCGPEGFMTRVIEAVPDHKDLFTTPEEQALNDPFTPCCSRSKTRQLVLDI